LRKLSNIWEFNLLHFLGHRHSNHQHLLLVVLHQYNWSRYYHIAILQSNHNLHAFADIHCHGPGPASQHSDWTLRFRDLSTNRSSLQFWVWCRGTARRPYLQTRTLSVSLFKLWRSCATSLESLRRHWLTRSPHIRRMRRL